MTLTFEKCVFNKTLIIESSVKHVQEYHYSNKTLTTESSVNNILVILLNV